jgi:hypothetical protein
LPPKSLILNLSFPYNATPSTFQVEGERGKTKLFQKKEGRDELVVRDTSPADGTLLLQGAHIVKDNGTSSPEALSLNRSARTPFAEEAALALALLTMVFGATSGVTKATVAEKKSRVPSVRVTSSTFTASTFDEVSTHVSPLDAYHAFISLS